MSDLQTTDINGFKLHYQDVGPRTASAIIFLHGFPLDHRQWRAQIEQLSMSYRCIAPDLRGHGRSDYRGENSMELMAQDVLALMDHLAVNRAVTVGLSMGGYVAFALWRLLSAQGQTQRIDKLALASTKAPADSAEAAQNRRRLIDAVQQRGSSAVVLTAMPRYATALHLDGNVGHQLERMINDCRTEAIIQTLRALIKRADSVPTLSTINVPTLILVGDQDVITPFADAELMHEKIAKSKLARILDSGHMTAMEQPQAFNKALQEFLK